MANQKYKIVKGYEGSDVGIWSPGLPKSVTLDATCDVKVLKYLHDRGHPGIIIEQVAESKDKEKK